MKHLLKNTWSEEDHSDFYTQLRNLPEEDQSKLVLMQAAMLSKVANHKDLDMLKAAESLVNFWIIKYSNSSEKGQADYLLENIQSGLRELE